jgi:hypothetical protein
MCILLVIAAAALYLQKSAGLAGVAALTNIGTAAMGIGLLVTVIATLYMTHNHPETREEVEPIQSFGMLVSMLGAAIGPWWGWTGLGYVSPILFGFLFALLVLVRVQPDDAFRTSSAADGRFASQGIAFWSACISFAATLYALWGYGLNWFRFDAWWAALALMGIAAAYLIGRLKSEPAPEAKPQKSRGGEPDAPRSMG